MVQGRLEKYFGGNRSINNFFSNIDYIFWVELKNVRPSDRCRSVRQMSVRPTDVCPSDRCPSIWQMSIRPSDRCPSVRQICHEFCHGFCPSVRQMSVRPTDLPRVLSWVWHGFFIPPTPEGREKGPRRGPFHEFVTKVIITVSPSSQNIYFCTETPCKFQLLTPPW